MTLAQPQKALESSGYLIVVRAQEARAVHAGICSPCQVSTRLAKDGGEALRGTRRIQTFDHVLLQVPWLLHPRVLRSHRLFLQALFAVPRQ